MPPNPPPVSGAMTLTLGGVERMRSARRSRIPCGSWVESQMVYESLPSS